MYKRTNLVINALKQINKTEEENKNVKKTRKPLEKFKL